MITKEDLIPGVIFKGFESIHHGRHRHEMMVLSAIDSLEKEGQLLYHFIFFPSMDGIGFGGIDLHYSFSRYCRTSLTLQEALSASLERAGTLQQALASLKT